MRRPVRIPVSRLHDLGEQFIGMQAALHQQLGFAGPHELDSLLRRRMTVRNVDDLCSTEIEGERLRDASDVVLGTNEDRADEARLGSLERALKRGLIARMGHGGRKRPERSRRRDQALVFFVLTQRSGKFGHGLFSPGNHGHHARKRRGFDVSSLECRRRLSGSIDLNQ